MSTFHPNARLIADDFLIGVGAFATKQIGSGTEGTVFQTSENTAIKIHIYDHFFQNELAVYQRLKEDHVESVCGFFVPQLLGFDSRLRAIEMTFVTPPYILDFGKSKVDFVDDFSDEAWEMWRDGNAQIFGEHWPLVERAVTKLQECWGIHHADLNVNNIQF
jgi:hypothetical protein